MNATKITLALVGGLLLSLALPVQADEDSAIAVLKSDAPHIEKMAACRELARIGTAKAVPVLAGMLCDEKLSHPARTALEPIPGPAVDAALREALGKAKGLPLVGVIGSVGVRKDAAAVGALIALLGDADPQVAQAAARALGKIGTAEGAKAILAVLPGTAQANQAGFCEGLLHAAELLCAAGQKNDATAIYDALGKLDKATQAIRTAALRGAIQIRGQAGLPLLMESVRSSDYTVVAAAARIAMEMPGAEVTAALVAELPKLPADKQILFTQLLGNRGDATAGPALLVLVSKGEVPVRLAAIQAVTQLRHAPAVAVLAELALGEPGELATLARQCLASFPGKEGDAALQGMLTNKDPKARSLAIELLVQRQASGAVATLLKGTDDQDETVRLACLRALRDLAGLDDLPALVDLLLKVKAPAELQALENDLGALCARSAGPASGNIVIVKAWYGVLATGPKADVTKKVAKLVKGGAASIEVSNSTFGDAAPSKVKQFRVDYTVNGSPASKTCGENDTVTLSAAVANPKCVDALCGALAKASPASKLSLLRVLRSAGGPKALQSVQTAASDADAEVKQTALRVICEWPTVEAIPVVEELAKNPPSPAVGVLALRAYVRLVPQQEASDLAKIEAMKTAMGLAKREDDKRLVLAALGSLPQAQSLDLIEPCLSDAKLKEEACIAAVAVAEKVPASAKVAAVMNQVAKTTSDAQLAQKAKALAKKAGR